MPKTESEIERIINRMVSNWFYTTPVLYKAVCKNPIHKNKNMCCEFRSGKSRIEYNPNLLTEKTPAEIKKGITLELSRIMLGHCTFRRPEPFDSETAIKASNMAILQENLGGLLESQSFEYYYKALNVKEDESEEGESSKIFSKSGSDENKSGEAEDATELWNDGDSFEELVKQQEMKELLEDENAMQQLGGILPTHVTNNIKGLLIIKKEKVHDKIKVAKVFMTDAQGLGKRIGTRNKPSRRFGFMQLGSKYIKDKVSLLCVLDVSGSISDEWVECYVNYLNFIKQKYKPVIDIVEADTEIKENTMFKMKTFISELDVVGRGGTDFQCVVNFLSDKKRKNKYDGAIVFTDGYVSKPDIPKGFKTKILWAVNKKNENFEREFPGEKYVAYLEN